MIRMAVLAGSCTAVLGMTAPAFAQIDGPVEFATDFPFVVSGRTMPAGRYEIRPVDEDQGVLRIAQMNGRASALFDVEPSTGPVPKTSEVVFDQSNDTFVLRTIRIADESEGATVVGARTAQTATAPAEKHVGATHRHHMKVPTTT